MTHYGDPSNIPASGIVMVSLSDSPVREIIFRRFHSKTAISLRFNFDGNNIT
jgi:hypothetical protein